MRILGLLGDDRRRGGQHLDGARNAFDPVFPVALQAHRKKANPHDLDIHHPGGNMALMVHLHAAVVSLARDGHRHPALALSALPQAHGGDAHRTGSPQGARVIFR